MTDQPQPAQTLIEPVFEGVADIFTSERIVWWEDAHASRE